MSNIVLNEDENARDEFSADQFFKQNRDYVSNNNLKSKPIIRKKIKGILCDTTNINNYSETLSLKRKTSDLFLGNENNKPKFNRVDKKFGQKFCFLPYESSLSSNYCLEFAAQPTSIEESESDSLSSLNNIYAVSEFIISLSVPANGYNHRYNNQIIVAEPWRCEKLLKIEHNSAIWRELKDTAKKEIRTLTVPCREQCSPRQQYSLTTLIQYKSDCLIQTYYSSVADTASFTKAIIADEVNKIIHKHPNHGHCYMPESINICHFHELYLEKLPCNNLFDFMPDNSGLSGSILGGFINDLFELSKHADLPSEVIHMAADYIYQYLSRIQNVPLNDLQLISLGAVWIAAKFRGFQSSKPICGFAECSLKQLKHAELRLLMVIDFNVTKPNAINFRNRFMIIEPSTSIISHISSFILDMTLHCYTVMILPASKRAAAAIWLARLIDKFDDTRFHGVDDDSLGQRMESVWPEHYQKLTGYSHLDIAQLAIKMHVIVLALLCHGQQNNPSVNACYNRYSDDKYKNLTGSYEKFTARVVYCGAELYCRVHGLSMPEWLENNEYDSLCLSVCGSTPDKRQYRCLVCPRHGEPDTNSMSSQPALAQSPDTALVKLDSGYETLTEFTIASLP